VRIFFFLIIFLQYIHKLVFLFFRSLLLFPINSLPSVCFISFSCASKSSFLSRTFRQAAREKIVFFFFSCCDPVFYVHKYFCERSLFSLTRRNIQYFSLAKAQTHIHRHHISRHVRFCSGFNCCTSSSSLIVFSRVWRTVLFCSYVWKYLWV